MKPIYFSPDKTSMCTFLKSSVKQSDPYPVCQLGFPGSTHSVGIPDCANRKAFLFMNQRGSVVKAAPLSTGSLPGCNPTGRNHQWVIERKGGYCYCLLICKS